MKNDTLTGNLWLRLEEMRCSMAIEGFELDNEQLVRIGKAYLRDPLPSMINELARKARLISRPLAEVVNDKLRLGLDFKRSLE